MSHKQMIRQVQGRRQVEREEETEQTSRCISPDDSMYADLPLTAWCWLLVLKEGEHVFVSRLGLGWHEEF